MADILNVLRDIEGFSAGAYVDASGHSIGFGHFIKKGEEHLRGMKLSREQAENLLLKDVAEHTEAGLKGLKVPISNNQRVALQSLAYNAGPGAAQSIVRLLNEGKTQAAADKFSEYNKSRKTEGGPLFVNNELVKRRAYERKLFLTKDSEPFDEKFRGPGSSFVSSKTSIVESPKLAASPFSSAASQAQLGDSSRVLFELKLLNQRLTRDRLESGGSA